MDSVMLDIWVPVYTDWGYIRTFEIWCYHFQDGYFTCDSRCPGLIAQCRPTERGTPSRSSAIDAWWEMRCSCTKDFLAVLPEVC